MAMETGAKKTIRPPVEEAKLSQRMKSGRFLFSTPCPPPRGVSSKAGGGEIGPRWESRCDQLDLGVTFIPC